MPAQFLRRRVGLAWPAVGPRFCLLPRSARRVLYFKTCPMWRKLLGDRVFKRGVTRFAGCLSVA
jgi:hypothetical protein